MGYYIPNNQPIETMESVELLPNCPSFDNIPEDKALICAVDNGMFMAYGLMYSQQELEDFNYEDDKRRKEWFLMDKSEAHKLSDYK